MSKYKEKTINKEQIKPIKTTTFDPDSIKGYEIIPMLYANIYICAQKRSGKTNLINKILEKCIDSDTQVIVFAATHDLDDNWKYIKEQLEKRKINAMYYSAIEEDKHNNLEDVLKYMKDAITSAEIKQTEDNPNNYIQIVKFDVSKGVKLKVKQPKKQVPKFMLIFDDMTVELKNKDIGKLLKTFRHYKSKVIVSSQWPNDIKPEARKQIDFFLLFGGHSKEKLEVLYTDMGISMPFESFYDVYKNITKEKYQFLYVNQHTGELRHNFDKKIIL